MHEIISSFQNPRIKLIKKLRDKRGRQQEARIVVDDTRDLLRALEHGCQVDFALYCPALHNADDDAVLAQLNSVPVYTVSRELIEKTSYRDSPGALLAVLHAPAMPALAALDAAQHPYVLGLVGLEKPGNIGALLRTADAAGFSTIFLIDTALDLYNPNIIRSSTGACFLGNVYALSTAEAQMFFKLRGYSVFCADVQGDVSLFAVDFGARSAVILGAEDTGLSTTWLAVAQQRVRIPMIGQLSDSLNVSVSGAVLMYAALRQRSTHR